MTPPIPRSFTAEETLSYAIRHTTIHHHVRTPVRCLAQHSGWQAKYGNRMATEMMETNVVFVQNRQQQLHRRSETLQQCNRTTSKPFAKQTTKRPTVSAT
jgi:hypothetical protein